MCVVLIWSIKSDNASSHNSFTSKTSNPIHSLKSQISGAYDVPATKDVQPVLGVNWLNNVAPVRLTLVSPVYSTPSISINKWYVIPVRFNKPLKFNSEPSSVSKSSSSANSKSGYKLSTNSVGVHGLTYWYFGLPKTLFSVKLPPNHNVVAGIIWFKMLGQ